MKPLHVAVDAHRLLCEPLTSGATYLQALVREWQRTEAPIELDLLLPFPPPESFAQKPLFQGPRVRLIHPPHPAAPTRRYRDQLLWQQSIIPSLIRQRRPDLYFSPFHLTPLLPFGTRVVTVIHDLCFLAERFFDLGSLVHRAELHTACRRACRLICVSEFTAAVLAKWAPRAARRSVVVPNGITAEPQPLQEATQRVRALDPDLTPRQFFVWVGTPSPRKSPELLFKIFAAIHRRRPGLSFAVVAPSVSHPHLQRLAQESAVADCLRLFSAIDNATRDSLYRCSLGLIFPSLCEGFGFPVVEAMVQGCPAFAIQDGPAREILGGLVPMARALTAEAFLEAIAEYSAKAEANWEERGAALSARAATFSANRMAAATLQVLQSAVANP